MTTPKPPAHWTTIAPKDAVDIDLTKRPDIIGPYNEEGEPCPWPWDPQQLADAPIGQYRCPYCGAMCCAGLSHPDYGPPTGEQQLHHVMRHMMNDECDACERYVEAVAGGADQDAQATIALRCGWAQTWHRIAEEMDAARRGDMDEDARFP